MPGLFFLIAYYFIIVQVSMGQDMLMQAGEFQGPFIWTVIAIMIWMLFAWYSSRLVSDTYVHKNKPPFHYLFRHFPRIIGYNVAVGLQLAVLNLPTVAALQFGIIVLLTLHNLFYVLLDRAFVRKSKPLLLAALGLSIIHIVYLYQAFPDNSIALKKNPQTLHITSCFFMSIFFFLFQIGFVWLMIWRREQLQKGRFQQKSNWKKGYDALAIGVFLLYVFILKSAWLADHVGALAATLLAFGLWIGFIYFIKNIAIKLHIRLGLPILVLAFIYGCFSHPYKVRLEKTETQYQYANRPDIDTYLNYWLQSPLRKDAITAADSAHPFNVYLVIADGGASKSGYWVASVLSKLEEETKSDFSKHLLSLAGASGGSVGNGAFYALLNEQIEKKQTVAFADESRKFFRGDFFTSSFARFLGPDLLRHFIPVLSVDDRAAVLERSMEGISESKLINNYFNGVVDTLFNNKGNLPMLFINTTNLQSGTPGVVSNIRINNDSKFTSRMDVLQLVDQQDSLDAPFKHSTMKLSTAVILGARFPYISPAGEINKKYFVDGGYFDNSGGGITLEVLQYLENRMNDTADNFNKLKHKLAFKVIYISNGNAEKGKDKELHPLVNDLAAPLLTVLGTYSKQTSMSNDKLRSYMLSGKLDTAKCPFQTLNLPMPNDTTDKMTYPMNWVISDYHLQRMDNNLKYVHAGDVLR